MRRNKEFVARSVMGTISFFKESVFADEHAAKNGFLQHRDPRVKAAAFLALLVAVLLTRDTAVIAAVYALILAAAFASKINVGFFLKRTWVFIPLFSLFIAIPALFSAVSPGEPVFVFNLLAAKFIVTRQGAGAAALFVSRVITSVSICVLLALTTRHNALLSVLRVFRIPQIFVMTLGMCYRYIYLFAEVVEYTYLGIKSRVGSSLHHTKGRQIVAWSIAGLWQRSYQLNNQVYGAMLSRGYRGEPKVYEEFKAGPADWVMLACVLALCMLVVRPT